MDGRKFLSTEEREHLEAMLRERLDTDVRNATMLLTALYTGARAMELLQLTWHEIDLKTGEIFISTLKGGKPRTVVVPKFLRDALTRLKATSPDKPFDLSYNRLGEIWREYRPVKKPFHCLRHSFAMQVYRKTKDIRFTQRALGHKNIQNTMIYADYEYTSSEFRKMMRIR